MPGEPDDEQVPARSVVCGCDDLPLGLPDAPKSARERSVVVSALPAQQAEPIASVGPTVRYDHWPHGPPPAIPLLATIILLN